MSKLLVSSFFDNDVAIGLFADLPKSLATRNVSDVIEKFNLYLAFLPFDDYNKATYKQRYVSTKQSETNYIEFHYRSLLCGLLHATGVDVVPESHGSMGSRDIVIRHKGIVWVIELKIKKTQKETERTLLENAIKQINTNRYAKAYVNPVCLAIVIDNKTRTITSWKSL
jgi:hypothetical protein